MRHRQGVRLIIINDDGEVLLFKHRYEDLFVPSFPQLSAFWATPGGGIEAGETYQEAARRELWEETGLTAVTVGPCVWTRELHVVVRGEDLLKRDRFCIVPVEGYHVSWENAQPDEHETFVEYRWWSIEELRSTSEFVSPPGLPDLLEELLVHGPPLEPIPI